MDDTIACRPASAAVLSSSPPPPRLTTPATTARQTPLHHNHDSSPHNHRHNHHDHNYIHRHHVHRQVQHVFPDGGLRLPPKKSIGRKGSKFIEGRREALQEYLR